MARSTGYPGCGDCAHGYREQGFNTEATCLLSCKNDCICICVEPEITNLAPWSLLSMNADGIATQITIDNMAELVGDRSEVYFTICGVNPRETGKQRYFSDQLKVNANCISWAAMGATTPEHMRMLARIALRRGIHIRGVQTN